MSRTARRTFLLCTLLLVTLMAIQVWADRCADRQADQHQQRNLAHTSSVRTSR